IKKTLFLGVNPMLHSAILFRANFINYNPSAKTSQDFDLYLRMSLLGKLENLEVSLVKFLRQEESISSRRVGEQFFNHLEMHKQFIACMNKRSELFVENGANFEANKYLFKEQRVKYFNFIFGLFGIKKSLISRVLKNILIPDLLFY